METVGVKEQGGCTSQLHQWQLKDKTKTCTRFSNVLYNYLYRIINLYTLYLKAKVNICGWRGG